MSELVNIALTDKPDVRMIDGNFDILNNDKIEVENIIQGQNIQFEIDGKNITISATGGSSGSGVGLQYIWDGTLLGIKREDEIDYTYVDLKGIQGLQGVSGNNGIDGINGLDGINGKDIEMRYDNTYLQYRLVGNVNWINLVQIETAGDLTALTGRVTDLETNQGDLTLVPTELQNKTIAEMITEIANTSGGGGGFQVSITDFGGKDDGVTDNRIPFLNAKSVAGIGGTVVFPRTFGSNNSVYYFSSSTITDTENITLDVAEGTKISYAGNLLYGQPLKLTRDTMFFIRAFGINRLFPATPIKKHFISESDLDKSELTPVLASGLVGMSSPWSLDYNAVPITFTQISSKEVSVGKIDGIIGAVGLNNLGIGEVFTASFSNVGTAIFAGGALILTADSYTFIYINDNAGQQSVVIGTKRGGAPFTQKTYLKFENYLSYKAQNVLWSIELVSATSFRVIANGINISKGIIDMGSNITFCGFGAYNNSFTLSNMIKEKNKVKASVEPLRFTLFGDSLTADIYRNWAHTFREALDGSFGLKVMGIENKAVGGASSSTQLTKMQNEGIANADYVIIQLGTNDIQAQVPVDTYVANIQAMITIVQTAGAKVVLGIPPLYYSSAFSGIANSTSNYEKGSLYRSALLRFASEKNIKTVDLLAVLGVVKAEFDVVYDNIHPSFKTAELIGLAFAKAVLGDYLTRKNNVGTIDYGKMELLLHGEDFADSSPTPKTIVNNNATIVSGKFGNAIQTSGGTSYVKFGNIGDWNFMHNGLEDYTAHFWFKPMGSKPFYISTNVGATNTSGFVIALANGACRFFITRGEQGVHVIDIQFPLTNMSVFTHIAITKSGNSYKAYENGVLKVSATAILTHSLANHTNNIFGTYSEAVTTLDCGGIIDEFMIEKGFVRWSGNFTPPTGEHIIS